MPNMLEGPIKKFAMLKPKKAAARNIRFGASPMYIPTKVALMT